jgi:phosphoadenosine phosphosulfate reductase
MEITPPGDARPGFSHDIELARRTLDSQFGPGAGAAVLPEGRLVVLNKAPALDRMDEVIADGAVLGTMRYDVGRGWTFLPRMQAARAMEAVMTKGRIVADDGAVPFVLKGSNLLAPGVVDVDPGIKAGDEVVVLDRQGHAIAAGLARMASEDMTPGARGMAVKVRWVEEWRDGPEMRASTWEDAIEANRPEMDRKVSEAVAFMKRVIGQHDLPAMISFSGGKDSLATLLVAKRAGLDLPVFFIDTGLEFPETIQHVKDVAARHGSRLIVEQAPREAFQEGLRVFGPPGRDYRWCCKTNKLGPTVRAIMKHYPDGVLSFIGQRRYESEARASKPRVWNNPWTPGQVGASPIQNWTALHVWLLIMSEGEKANPWYERGLDRIGCFLCPASDLAELELVKEGSPLYADWLEALRQHAGSRGLPQEWIDYGAWRWRRMPSSYRQELDKAGIEIGRGESKAEEPTNLRLFLAKGVSPCIMGFSIEGAFSRPLDLDRVKNVLNLIGPVELSTAEGWCSVDGVTVFEEGAVIAKGPDVEGLKEKVEEVRRAVVNAEECVGCGVCIARCCEGALRIELGKIVVNEATCIHCGRCAEPCPAVTFGDAAFDF